MKKEKLILTRKGRTNLEEKLRKLEREYMEVSRGKMEAAETGGNLWHDNPAYDEVEQRQTILSRLIAETKDALSRAAVVAEQREPSAQGKVEIGVAAEIVLDGTKRLTMRLGGAAESDPGGGVVSYLSPLGTALIGAGEGEERSYVAGGRTVSVRVVKIKRD